MASVHLAVMSFASALSSLETASGEIVSAQYSITSAKAPSCVHGVNIFTRLKISGANIQLTSLLEHRFHNFQLEHRRHTTIDVYHTASARAFFASSVVLSSAYGWCKTVSTLNSGRHYLLNMTAKSMAGTRNPFQPYN